MLVLCWCVLVKVSSMLIYYRSRESMIVPMIWSSADDVCRLWMLPCWYEAVGCSDLNIPSMLPRIELHFIYLLQDQWVHAVILLLMIIVNRFVSSSTWTIANCYFLFLAEWHSADNVAYELCMNYWSYESYLLESCSLRPVLIGQPLSEISQDICHWSSDFNT